MRVVFLIILVVLKVVQGTTQSSIDWPLHQLASTIQVEIAKCRNISYCNENINSISVLCTKLSNDYAAIMLAHTAQKMMLNFFSQLPASNHSLLRLKMEHIVAVLAFSQGDLIEAERHWPALSAFNLVSQRTLVAQVLMGGSESQAISLVQNYSTQFGIQFSNVLKRNNLFRFGDANGTKHNASSSSSSSGFVDAPALLRSPSTEESEEAILSLLLSEAQGGVRVNSRLSDVHLSLHEHRPVDARQRFRLGVGLAKLGLFDLSLRHVSLSATPWEGPLYRLRARLVFSPVHGSIRHLAQAVDAFVRQGEGILSQAIPKSTIMSQVCNSPNEAALALQALPLLHLAGFAAPREKLQLGHAPVALPVLLSEVFLSMCPPLPVSSRLESWLDSSGRALSTTDDGVVPEVRQQAVKPLVVGFVAGSLDGITGRIVVALAEKIKSENRGIKLIAMCFPTPRDPITDKAATIFDSHVNLSPHNKSQGIERISDVHPDLIIFTDAALDSRVFTLAHERLAPFQAALWSWGGTLGIPTIDYYFIPELLISHSRCPMQNGQFNKPQQLYAEQVVLLEGLPPLLNSEAVDRHELQRILRDTFLLPTLNDTHMYLFPGSVKHLHPEFDAALTVLLRTDSLALVLLAVPKTGRDKLPTTHVAVRHDLMHPTMPAAAVAKLRNRLIGTMGESLADRVRVLPPLEDKLYKALMLASIAVFDPFPVGMHVQVLEALMSNVPVISAPSLQECTNSHTDNLARELQLGPHYAAPDSRKGCTHDCPGFSSWAWPSTPEEYAVLALRMQRDASLRQTFRWRPDEYFARFSASASGMETDALPSRGSKANGNEEDEEDEEEGDYFEYEAKTVAPAPDAAVVMPIGNGNANHGLQLVKFIKTLSKLHSSS